LTDPSTGEAQGLPATSWLKGNAALAGRYLHLSVVLGLLGGLLIIAQAWWVARIVNGVVFEAATLSQVSPWMIVLLLLFLLRAAAVWLSEQVAFKAAAGVKIALRDQLYAHLQRLGPAYIGNAHSGELSTTLSDGVEALEAYYARYLPALSLMALVPLAILASVFPFDRISALVMLLTAPLIPFFMILIGKGAEKRNQRQWRQLARMSAHFLDVIQGLTTLKLFNASRREIAMIAQVSEAYRHSTMSVLRLAFLSAFTLEFFSTVSIAVVAVLIGFRLYWGEMAFMNGFFVLLLAPEFYLPLRNMGSHYHARMEAIGAAERMVEILAKPAPTSPPVKKALPDLCHIHVRFLDVSYRYASRQTGVHHLDFEIQPGERLALVGPSGAGKSTTARLLLGFLQAGDGRILINDMPLDTLDPDAWRQHLAWVPQRPHLFYGTVLDNIRLGMPDADESAVIEAARTARAHTFVKQLPEGYHTRVGEGGRPLSGGQIQRLALARAFLRDAPLVILDEATANLDLESERQIQAAIDTLAQGRTLLVIAHRLNTVRKADRILVLQNGCIVQSGRHAQLLAEEGLYRRMAQAWSGRT